MTHSPNYGAETKDTPTGRLHRVHCDCGWQARMWHPGPKPGEIIGTPLMRSYLRHIENELNGLEDRLAGS